MPPQTRGVKVFKENVTVTTKKKNKINTKTDRKPLADKTNSASDDNTSGLGSLLVNGKSVKKTPDSVKERSRRNRRLPTRYEENNILINLSNFSPLSPKNVNSPSPTKAAPSKTVSKLTPHKTPSRISSSPLINKRPKRICRLPSKFDAHFISPTKNTSIEPPHSSTPIPIKSKKKVYEVKNVKPQIEIPSNNENKKESTGKTDTKRTRSGGTTSASIDKVRSPFKTTGETDKRTRFGATTSASIDKVRSPFKTDVSVEAKSTKQVHKKTKYEAEPIVAKNLRQKNVKNNLQANLKDIILKSATATTKKTDSEKNLHKNNISFRLLENKNNSLKRDSSKLDIYEFTFDPSEEPPPQKKKKKRNPRNPNKPKKVVKSTYDKNLERALASLKQAVAFKNNAEIMVDKDKAISNKATSKSDEVSVRKIMPDTSSTVNADVSKGSENRYNSIRIEDIAMQFQDNTHHESVKLNYSPVDTPMHPMSPVYETDGVVEHPAPTTSNHSSVQNKTPEEQKGIIDPLNLQDHVSFFDEEPVASSSMNLSTRHPTASPWRVEFNNLPIKWQVNSYVKPNMTPAVEKSFINYNDSQKKHVYTNIITELNESLPHIEDNTPLTSNLKQTSILSFIKEVVEKKASKKKKPLIVQTNSLFEDTHIPETTLRRTKGVPEVIVEKCNTSGEDVQSENSGVKNSSCDSEKVINSEMQQENDKNDMTYFGFDESENQENVSPIKTKTKKKKTKTRKALRAINGDLNKPVDQEQQLAYLQMPIAVMSKPARLPNQLNKVFDEAKAATEPPIFPEQHIEEDTEVTNVDTDFIQSNIDDEDCNSVHLFEDIELVHHLKPMRKSYGKSKKVTFHQSSAVNNFNSDNEKNGSSDEDDLDDLSFKLPSVKEKKPTKKKTTKKQKLSKKEEKEADEWAAGFNSMCEDIDEFDLVVE